MKVEDSGMPDEHYWNSLFDLEKILEWLPLHKKNGQVVEIGCGYGTFTVPIAKRFAGKVYAFDIEQSMIEAAQKNAYKDGVSNIIFELRDVLENGTGLKSDSVDLVLLFNILHLREKRIFLEEASRILKNTGTVAILHWRTDITTPRGPAMNVRPDKKQIISASDGLNLSYHGNIATLEPYHWGIQLSKEVR